MVLTETIKIIKREHKIIATTMKSTLFLILIGLFGAMLAFMGRFNLMKEAKTSVLLGSLLVFIGFFSLGVPLFLLFLTVADYIFCNNSCAN